MSGDVVVPQVFSARMVRELKGAPLSCLILLAVAGGPVHNEWLCRMSGYTDKPISQALKLLSSPEYQIARRTRGGWVISKAFQLVLSDESRNFSVPTTTTSTELLDKESTEVVVVSRNFSDFEDDGFVANLEACKRAGIAEPSASLIAGLDHVTPEYINAHVAGLVKGDRLGLAIVRIKNNEVPPEPATQERVRNYSVSAFDEYFHEGAA